MKIIKNFINNKKKIWQVQMTSWEWFQPELQYAYVKSGGNNQINEEFVKAVYEPDNKADPDAVAIYFNGLKIGYLPRGENVEYKNLKFKSNERIRTYYYNNQYRAEFCVDYLY